jgi:hypothetical protein
MHFVKEDLIKLDGGSKKLYKITSVVSYLILKIFMGLEN